MAKKSNFDLNDLSTWGLPVVGLFSIIIVGAIVFVANKAVIEDVTREVANLDSKIKTDEEKYAKDKKFVALLPHVREEVSKLQLVRDEAKKYLPTEVSMPSLIDNVYLAARDNGIVFKTFTPGNDIDTTYYTIKPISLSADVGYISMSSFIEQVTTLKRIMNVHSVSFKKPQIKLEDEASRNDANQPLAMTAELRTYIFKESLDFKEDK